MITHFKIRCRSFVWYVVVAFTICSIPHFELLPAEFAGMLGREAYAAQTPSSSCPVHEYVYDARGRVVTERQRLENGISETNYAYSGFSTTKADPEGLAKTETRDYLGRMVRVEEGFEGRVLQIAYTYNAVGDLLVMTDPRGSATAMAYDSLGQRVSLVDPNAGVWSYAYDSNGNLVKQTDPTGHSVKDKKENTSNEKAGEALAVIGAVIFLTTMVVMVIGLAFVKSGSSGDINIQKFVLGGVALGTLFVIIGAVLLCINQSAKEKTEEGKHGVLIDYTGAGLQCGHDIMLRS